LCENTWTAIGVNSTKPSLLHHQARNACLKLAGSVARKFLAANAVRSNDLDRKGNVYSPVTSLSNLDTQNLE
jgi:hypothetical protein